jgi:hypothetical protein
MRAVTLPEPGTTCIYYCSQRVNHSMKRVKLPSASCAINVPVLPLRHSPRSLQLSFAGICSFLSPSLHRSLSTSRYNHIPFASRLDHKRVEKYHMGVTKCLESVQEQKTARTLLFKPLSCLRCAVVPAMAAGTCGPSSGALPGWVRGRGALRGGAGPRRWRGRAGGLCC